MPLTFYPHSDDTQRGSFEDRVDILREAAERYKSIILDAATKASEAPTETHATEDKRNIPKDQVIAYNWEEIAILLREIRALPEVSKGDKLKKADLLTRLAEVYEVLRGAKMSKLEAVRLALIAEANQLRGGATESVG